MNLYVVEFSSLIDLVVNAKMAFLAGNGSDPSIGELVKQLSVTTKDGSIVAENWSVDLDSLRNEALRARTPTYKI